MTESGRRAQLVAVATTDFLVGEIAAVFEFDDDPLGGTLGDTGYLGKISHANVRVLRDKDQHSRVAGEERPRSPFVVGHPASYLRFDVFSGLHVVEALSI